MIGGLIGSLFGELDGILYALLVFIIIDYLTPVVLVNSSQNKKLCVS